MRFSPVERSKKADEAQKRQKQKDRRGVLCSDGPFPKKSAFLQAIRDGKLLYLQLSHNARYGSHHLLCYGYTTVCSTDGEHWEVYLLLADGWSAQPRYLPLSETGICHFFEIGAESR